MKGEIAVRYTIRHFDLPLLTFEANMDSADTDLHIIKVYEENRSFLPLNLTVSEDGVERWLRHRTIPKNRAYVDALLSKVGLSLNRPLGIITVCKGLSLNDCFWVDAEGSGDTFEKVNLYDNRFSQVLAAIAFTGYGSSIRTSLASCPEFSTNGMLPKCWRRQNGKIYLYKGGTSRFSNLGFEPYSEMYAYQVAQVMGVNAIRYTLTKDLKKTLCSKCELFTGKEYSYIPIGQLVSKGGIKAILAYYQTLGQNFVDALEDMLVFDAIICNVDRTTRASLLGFIGEVIIIPSFLIPVGRKSTTDMDEQVVSMMVQLLFKLGELAIESDLCCDRKTLRDHSKRLSRLHVFRKTCLQEG
mgnify:CR=1 FL=1